MQIIGYSVLWFYTLILTLMWGLFYSLFGRWTKCSFPVTTITWHIAQLALETTRLGGETAKWPVYLLRKALPNALSLRKGFFGSTTRAFPGITPSWSPCITAIKESVVGSGPIRIPGKSCSIRCRINVVFPVEYWPTRRTMGLLSKSASSSAGEWKSWNRYVSSNGKSLVR